MATLSVPIKIDDHSKIYEVWTEFDMVFLVIQVQTENVDQKALVRSHVRGFCGVDSFRNYMKRGAIYSASYFDIYGRQFLSIATDERLCRRIEN